MNSMTKRYFEVYGEESGYINSFDSLVDAYYQVKSLKEFDKSHNIKDKYYYQLCIENDNELKIYDIKVRKYGAFIKFILV